MARIKCRSCSEWINDTDERCYSCGAVNEDYRRLIEGSPKTIQELCDWVKNETATTPLYFVSIGSDVNEPGYKSIVKEGRSVMIYHNDETGNRTVVYQGTDESYAVNMMFFDIQQMLTKKRDMNARAAVAVGQAISKEKNKTDVNIPTEKLGESDGNGAAVVAWLVGFVIIGILALILIF